VVQNQGLESKIEKMRAAEEEVISKVRNGYESQVEALNSQVTSLESTIADHEEAIKDYEEAMVELEQQSTQKLKAKEEEYSRNIADLMTQQQSELHRMRTHMEAEQQSLKSFIYTTARSMLNQVENEGGSILGKSMNGAVMHNESQADAPFSPSSISFRTGESGQQSHTPFRLKELEKSQPDPHAATGAETLIGHKPLNPVALENKEAAAVVSKGPTMSKDANLNAPSSSSSSLIITDKENQVLDPSILVPPSNSSAEPLGPPQHPVLVDPGS